jgi:hypothetical protein
MDFFTSERAPFPRVLDWRARFDSHVHISGVGPVTKTEDRSLVGGILVTKTGGRMCAIKIGRPSDAG